MTVGLVDFKNRLARIRVGSVRYQIANGFGQLSSKRTSRIRNARACSFYWFYLPTGILAMALYGMAVAGVAFITYGIAIPVSWVLGFTPDRKNLNPTKDPGAWTWHGGYGYNPATKSRHKVAYQHILLAAAAVGFLGWSGWFDRPSLPHWLVILFGALAAAAVLSLTVAWLTTNRAVREGWHRICPPLELQDAEVDSQEVKVT